MMADYYLKQNDTGPYLEAILRNASGVEDLTNATVKFKMRNSRTNEVIIDAAATVVDATNGHVRYAPQVGDTESSGSFSAEWEVTFLSGIVQTYPNDGYLSVKISDDIDP